MPGGRLQQEWQVRVLHRWLFAQETGLLSAGERVGSELFSQITRKPSIEGSSARIFGEKHESHEISSFVLHMQAPPTLRIKL